MADTQLDLFSRKKYSGILPQGVEITPSCKRFDGAAKPAGISHLPIEWGILEVYPWRLYQRRAQVWVVCQRPTDRGDSYRWYPTVDYGVEKRASIVGSATLHTRHLNNGW